MGASSAGRLGERGKCPADACSPASRSFCGAVRVPGGGRSGEAPRRFVACSLFVFYSLGHLVGQARAG
eukprot:scaffold1228_cov115-Isochrysis_galbana.AAC.7